jgi:glycosyltransferase involved in cell wall biosynthesis
MRHLPRRVLFCKGSVFDKPSGLDEVVINYAAALKDEGVSASLLVMSASSSTYHARFREQGLRVDCVTSTPMYTALRLARRAGLLRGDRRDIDPSVLVGSRASTFLLRRLKPDLVHILEPHGHTSAVAIAAHAMRIPMLYQEPAIPTLSLQWYHQLRDALSLFSGVTALSPRHVAIFKETLGFEGRVDVLPCMSADPGAPRPPNRRDRLTVGFAARMDPGKGGLDLIEAVKLLVSSDRAASFRLAGDGPELDRVKRRVRELGLASACEFLGAYSGDQARSAFMRSIDVFVLPSYSEGTPNAVIEAMAHGLPTIATNVGGLPDMLLPGAGIVVPPGDARSLAAAIAQLASSRGEREAMGRLARERYKVLFSPEAVVPVLLRAYQRALLPNDHEHASLGDVAHPWAQPTA